MKWVWAILLSLLLFVAGVEVAGYFLPDRLDVEREAVIEAPLDDVWRTVSDLGGWKDWSPILADRDGMEIGFELLDGGTGGGGAGAGATGDGAQMVVRFGQRLAVLFTVVEFAPPTRFALNTRSGDPDADLLAGEGFEGWDEFDLEAVGPGATRVRWRRTSGVLESYWMRVVDAVASGPQVGGQLERGLVALAGAVGAPEPEVVTPDE